MLGTCLRATNSLDDVQYDPIIVRSAARYFDASSQGVSLPLGLGSRDMAGASMSLHTVAIVVSESSMVPIFESGEVATEIAPEFWMLRRYGFTPQTQDATGLGTYDKVTVIERSQED